MPVLEAIILGIVEGITEFLPISSTGHLILTSHLLRVPQTEFVKSFEIVIQFGAILSVICLYFKSFFKLEVIKKLAAAFIPTAIIGFALYEVIKNVLIGSTYIVLWALFLGGIALILFEKWHVEKPEGPDSIQAISYKQAVAIGLFQAIAVIPGVSRAAATILGGLIMGIKRKTIIEFSFLLAVPTMLAASALDLLQSAPVFTKSEYLALAIGFTTSFLVALAAIKWLLKFIGSHTFTPFGIYRIIIATLFFVILF